MVLKELKCEKFKLDKICSTPCVLKFITVWGSRTLSKSLFAGKRRLLVQKTATYRLNYSVEKKFNALITNHYSLVTGGSLKSTLKLLGGLV